MLLKGLDQAVDLAVVDRDDRDASGCFLLFRTGLLDVLDMGGHCGVVARGRTLRAKIMSSYFPSALMASTRARPSWPVPPATATMWDMVLLVDGLR